MEASGRFVYAIQILRGAAAALIMLHHFNQMLPWPHAGLVLFGYDGDTGVDIFFIISGFVMVKSTEAPRHAKPLAFGIRRGFRVLPLAEICTMGYFLLLLGQPAPKVLFRSLFFIPLAAVDPPKFGWSLVPQMWTLSYEIVFYAIFGLSLIFTHRRRILLASGLIFASIFIFQYLLGGPFSWRPEGIYLPPVSHRVIPVEIVGVLGNPILLEFIPGMLLAWAYRYLERVRDLRAWRIPVRLAGLGLIGIFLAIYFSRYEAGHGLQNKHGYGALCLVAGALLLEASLPPPLHPPPPGRMLSVLMWLGAISYPLYLVHLGIVGSVVHYLPAALVPAATSGVSGFLTFVAVSLALAALLHRWVELPSINLGKRLVRRISPRAAPRPAPAQS